MQDSFGSRRLASQFQSSDPFAGFALGSHNSFCSDLFERDPFDDPFFTRPFGGSMFGSDSFFQPFRRSPRVSFIEAGPQASHQGQSRGPVIEELDEEEDDAIPPRSSAKQEPIVEHPDDEIKPRYAVKKHDIPAVYDNSSTRFANATQSYSYFVSYGGPGGTYYSSSTSRRTGGDVVVEEHHEEKDLRTGRESRRVMHGLHDKGHVVTQHGNAEGGEHFVETLHNIGEAEKQDFDETWRKEAEKHLPGWKNHKQLESGVSGMVDDDIMPSIEHMSR